MKIKLFAALNLILILMIILCPPAQSNEGESLFQEGLKVYRLNKFDLSLPYFQKARDWFKEHHCVKEEAEALCYAGTAQSALNHPDLAIVAFREALTLMESLQDEKSQVSICISLGDLFLVLGDLSAARQYGERALKGAEAFNDKENIAHALLSLGIIEQSEGNAEKARPLLEKSCTLSREQRNESLLASALGSLGVLQSALADYDGAEASLTEALSLYKKNGGKLNEGVVLVSLGTLYRNRGNLEKAFKCFENALTIASEVQNLMLESSVTGYLGSILEKRGEPEKALQYYEKSLALKKELNNPAMLTGALNDLGNFYWNRGDFTKALSYFSLALKNADDLKLVLIKPALLINKGSVLDSMGEYEEAMRIFLEALELVRKYRDRAREAIVLNNLGNIYYRLSYYEKALESFQQSLSISQAIGNRTGEAISLSNLGQLYSATDDPDRAMEYYQKARELQRESGDISGEAKTLNNIGQLYSYKAMREPLLYKKALIVLEEAMALAKKSADSSLEGTIFSNMGYVALETLQYGKAITLFTSSVDIARMQGDRRSEAFNLASLGFTYEMMDRPEKACDMYIGAIEIIESMASRFKIDEYKQRFFRDHHNIYSKLIELLRGRNRDSDAFIYNERSRSRALLDMLSPVNVALRKNRASSSEENERIALQERQLREEIAALETTQGTLDGKERTKKIDTLVNEHKDVLIKLSRSDPDYAQLVSVKPPDLREIQNKIPVDSALLEYYVEDKSTVLWVLTGDDITSFTLRIESDDLWNEVEAFREAISSSGNNGSSELKDFKKRSMELYAKLIAPAEKELKGKKNLIIVPHRILYYLPFAALMPSQDEYMIKDRTITYAPSSSIWLLCLREARPASEKLVAFASGGNTPSSEEPSMRNALRLISSSGNYLKDFPPLPGTLKEVESITSLYENSECYIENDMTLEKVKKTTVDAPVIHFATHGILDSSHPVFSGLLLKDTILSVSDIFRLNLSATLVVLSGCKTALGEKSLGDEIVGMSRAFMYAGTPSVVATLWSISDESSVLFMEEFHRHFKEGKSKAESMREAQCTVEARYSSPFYWAPFILIGDGNR